MANLEVFYATSRVKDVSFDSFESAHESAMQTITRLIDSGYQQGRVTEWDGHYEVELTPPSFTLESGCFRVIVDQPIPYVQPTRLWPASEESSNPQLSRFVQYQASFVIGEADSYYEQVRIQHEANRRYLRENSAAHWGSESTTSGVVQAWIRGIPAHNRHGSIRTRNHCLYSYNKLVAFVFNGMVYVLDVIWPNNISVTTTSHLREVFHAARISRMGFERVTPAVIQAYARYTSRNPESRQHAFVWPAQYGLTD